MYRYFYFPDRIRYDSPARAGLDFETVSFASADSTRLVGWFIPATTPQPARGTVVHMHGNAQNMSAHWAYAEWLPTAGYNLFVFDYRGYGDSHGRPEPEGMFHDAVAALDYVRSRPDIDPDALYVFGQSLGGMLAIAATAANPQGVCAVLAEAPVRSYTAWAEDQMPQLELAVEDTYCASTYIGRLGAIPLLLLHSPQDRVVPYSHSQALLEAASGPARLLTIPDGEHNDAMTDRHGTHYQEVLLQFFAQPEQLGKLTV